MAKKDTKGITVKKEEDIAEWYQQVCIKGEVADYSSVKGCMIIKPTGMTMWEKVQDYFNQRIKKIGVKNVYFPLFIPESYFKREAQHAEGFAPEVAWIEQKDEGEERVAVRPTSETAICESFSKWTRSYRDLPIRVNQWCNVVRWETEATKLFLRSREFLWQEGHCIYATKKEAEKETLKMLKEYKRLMEDLLAVPVIIGKKTKKEAFAGAVYTTTAEAFMTDGKALQMGTSHYLGTGFMEGFDVKYLGEDEKMHTPHYISWGVSTRMIGATIMMHSDNKGLVLPPKLAPIHTVIVPILFEGKEEGVLNACKDIEKSLRSFDVVFDNREEYSAGWKFNDWEMKGVPIRIEVGPKDVENKQCVLVRRDTGEKISVGVSEVKEKVKETLNAIQKSLFDKAQEHLEHSFAFTEDFEELKELAKQKKLVRTYFCGDVSCEEEVKAETQGISSRVIPLDAKKPKDKKCFHCKKPAKVEVFFSRSY